MKSNQQLNYKIIDQYVIILRHQLGRGAFGTVFMGLDTKTQNQLAIKQISLEYLGNSSEKVLTYMKNEIVNMHKLKHPNIVQLVDVKKSSHNLYLILEYCDENNLEEFVKKRGGRLSEYEGLVLMKQIVEGFRHMYQLSIVHRDLKPANILMHKGQCKIGDFGFSKAIEGKMQEQVLQTQVGTPLYMSPQLLRAEKYSFKTDVWSCGFIFYEMLFGKTPWEGKSPCDLLQNIINKKLVFPAYISLKNEVKDLLSRMLQINENDRISWDEIFEHDVFKEEQNLMKNSILTLYSLENMDKDKLIKYKNYNQIYFTKYKVLRTAYLDKEMNNEIMRETKELIAKDQKITNEQQSTKESQQNTSASYQLANSNETDILGFVENQCMNQKNKKEICVGMAQWVLHRRNKAIFLNCLGVELFNLIQEQEFNCDLKLYYRLIFILIKYAMMIIYKIYARLKSGNDEKYQKFNKEQWNIFFKSQERDNLLEAIRCDLGLIKYFFDELVQRTSKFIAKVLSKENNNKIQQLQQICNNSLSNMKVFKQMYQIAINDFFEFVTQTLLKNLCIQNKKVLDFLLQMCYAKNLTKQFKWNKQNIKDFHKFYEEIKKMDQETSAKKINEQIQEN